MYGLNPFTNQNSKIMQILIKRYPVVFPEPVKHDPYSSLVEGGLSE